MASSSEDAQIVYRRGMAEDHEDIWDDTVLIEAYEKAAGLAYDAVHASLRANGEYSAEQLKGGSKKLQPPNESYASSTAESVGERKKKRKKNSKRRSKKKFDIGDKCLAKYEEDGVWYEAIIIALDRPHNRCTVRFVDYENEQICNLGSLQKCPETSVEDESSVTGDEMDDGEEMDRASYDDVAGTSKPNAVPLLPPPTPPHWLSNKNGVPKDDEAMAAMLMSWYMSGYHTGYYQAMRDMQQKRHKK